MIFEIEVQGYGWYDYTEFDELFSQLPKDVDTIHITDCNDNLSLNLHGEVTIAYLKELASNIEYLEDDYEDEFYALLDYFNNYEEAYEYFMSGRYCYIPTVFDEYQLGEHLVEAGYFGDVEEGLKDFIDYNKLGVATVQSNNCMFTEFGYIEIY